jgi:aerobic carbon-monoxide dehydrogenase medium subunit
VKPGRFTYHAPRELDEALALLTEHGDEAKVLAGGQSLMPMLNFRLAQIEHLIDINRLGGLSAPRIDEDTITFPALVRQRQVERSPEMARALPLLTAALRQVAHPQIRNRGTICGSLAHADPAAELPCVMTALDARFTLASAEGVRTLDAGEFFQFHLTTALEPEEMLLEVTVDRLSAGTYTSFQEYAARHGDFALAGVAATCELDGDGVVTGCRVAAAGIAPTPQRLGGVEGAVTGRRVDDALASEVEAATREEIDPTSDIHASAAYRRRLTGVLVKRALIEVRTQWEAAHA